MSDNERTDHAPPDGFHRAERDECNEHAMICEITKEAAMPYGIKDLDPRVDLPQPIPAAVWLLRSGL